MACCPWCRHVLAADEESVYCPYCAWRPTELADWYDCTGFPRLGEERRTDERPARRVPRLVFFYDLCVHGCC
jgi:hypothetical protein